MKKILILLMTIAFGYSQSEKNAFELYNSGEYEKAFLIFEKECNDGNMESCYNLGIAYRDGNGVEKDLYKAHKLYEKSCNAGNSDACNNLANNYINGNFVPKSFEKANKLYEKSCYGANNGIGCYNLAISYKNGEGVPQSIDNAITLYKKSCDEGFERGCTMYNNLNNPNK